MPYHDLNLVHTTNIPQLNHTLSFATELGYRTLAIATVVNGNLPSKPDVADLTKLRQSHASLTLLTRLTLSVSDTSQNHRMSSLQSIYDIIAVRPLNEKSFQHCCTTLECDIISIDLSARLPFLVKFTTVAGAFQRGIRFEICYSPITSNSDAKRNLIAGATTLIRATRGRGIILSSEARSALGLRGPHDVMNLAQIWGLEQAKGKESLVEEPGKVVRLAALRRNSYRGVITVVNSGKPTLVDQGAALKPVTANKAAVVTDEEPTTIMKSSVNGVKRKASAMSLSEPPETETPPFSTNSATPNDSAPDDHGKPLSKRQQKKLAKIARLEARGGQSVDGTRLNGSSSEGQGGNGHSFPIQHETLREQKSPQKRKEPPPQPKMEKGKAKEKGKNGRAK